MTAQIDIIDYLTDIERSRLAELAAIVEKEKLAFVRVGNALIEIAEDKLYRETHATFEAYCEDVHNIKRRRAYQFREAARNVQEITQEGFLAPTVEATARILSKLPKEQRGIAWQWAQELSRQEQPTGTFVKSIVDDINSGNPAVYVVQKVKEEYRPVAWDVMLRFAEGPDADIMADIEHTIRRNTPPKDVDLVEFYTARVETYLKRIGKLEDQEQPPADDIEDSVRFEEQLRGLKEECHEDILSAANRIQSPTTAHIVGRIVHWVLYYDGYQSDGLLDDDELYDLVEREVRAELAGKPPIMWEPPSEPKPKKNAIESGYSEEQEKSLPAPDRPKDLEDVPEETGGELDRDAWCTPVWFIEEVVRPWLWGTIELDPCSNPHAQEKIGANVAYFEEHDGLERDWHGKGFMNPPYSQPKVTKFCEKLAKHHTEGDVPMAVAIINSTTDTNAYHALAKTARFEAHPNRRINFWHRDTTSEDYNRHKQTVFFFGDGDTSVIGELLDKGWSIKQRIDYGQDGDSAWAIRELVMAREALGVDLEADISLWRVIKCLMVHLDQHGITFDPDGFADQEESDGNDASMDHHFERADRLLRGEQ